MCFANRCASILSGCGPIRSLSRCNFGIEWKLEVQQQHPGQTMLAKCWGSHVHSAGFGSDALSYAQSLQYFFFKLWCSAVTVLLFMCYMPLWTVNEGGVLHPNSSRVKWTKSQKWTLSVWRPSAGSQHEFAQLFSFTLYCIQKWYNRTKTNNTPLTYSMLAVFRHIWTVSHSNMTH